MFSQTSTMFSKKYAKFLIFMGLGLVIVLICLVANLVIVPAAVRYLVSKQFRLIPGTETWEKWVDPPIPIYLTFYFFHVSNPDDVENGMLPVFQEKGPYAYRQRRTKVDFKQDSPNSVEYKEIKTYNFDEIASGGNKETDLVNIPNLPFVGVIDFVRKYIREDAQAIAVDLTGNHILENETFIKRNVPVKELLFDGFDVTKYTKSIMRRKLPKEFSGGRFGLFKGKNATLSEPWKIHTGYDDPANFGRVITWNNRPELGYWRPSSHCDLPLGTDGSIFPPFITKQTVLEAFSPDICRSLPLTYLGTTTLKGIPGYRFTAPEWVFKDPRINSDNLCYCLRDTLEECTYSGVLPLETCMKAPIWTSPAYFLDSDERYTMQSGLPPPDRDKHQAYIDLEPTTGLLLRAHKRLQFGLEARSHPNVTAFQDLPNLTYFPMFWLDENAEMSQELIDILKRRMITTLKIVNIILGILLGLGIVLFSISIGGVAVNYAQVVFCNKKEFP